LRKYILYGDKGVEQVSKYDIIYNNLIRDVLENGEWDTDQQVRTEWKDGNFAYTKAVIGRQIKLDNSEVPILTSKKVFWETAIKEMLWIWQKKSNNVQDLRDMGVNIWNEWEMEDGTIGKAYAWQLANKKRSVKFEREIVDHKLKGIADPFVFEITMELDQVDYLLWELKNKPASRRIKTTLWCVEDLDKMALTPCVYETHWIVKQSKLHLIVNIRSNDLFLGNPFNIFQYYVLQRMIAQVTEYELGTLTFNIDDAHVYDRHIDLVTEQLYLPHYEAPHLWLNPDVKNFYDFKMEDFELRDYKCGKFIRAEVAI
jgi:thymidylate synthase